MCLLEKQKIFWKQTAKQFWLRERDKNSHFFHKFASTNSTNRIKEDNRKWRESVVEVQGVITNYFSQLFLTGGVDEDLLESDRVRLVTEEQNNDLVRHVTGEEVKTQCLLCFQKNLPGLMA